MYRDVDGDCDACERAGKHALYLSGEAAHTGSPSRDSETIAAQSGAYASTHVKVPKHEAARPTDRTRTPGTQRTGRTGLQGPGRGSSSSDTSIRRAAEGQSRAIDSYCRLNPIVLPAPPLSPLSKGGGLKVPLRFKSTRYDSSCIPKSNGESILAGRSVAGHCDSSYKNQSLWRL